MQSVRANSHESSPTVALRRAEGLILVLDTPKGRGVFASRPISSGTVVEISPVLVFPAEQVEEYTRHTVLDHYTYTWPSAGSSARPTQAVALGLGSLFNHSTLYQNVGWKRLVAEQSIQYTALRNIPEGEELCISYGSPGVLWFEDADAEAVEKHQRDERDITFAESVNGEMAVSGLADIELDIA